MLPCYEGRSFEVSGLEERIELESLLMPNRLQRSNSSRPFRGTIQSKERSLLMSFDRFAVVSTVVLTKKTAQEVKAKAMAMEKEKEKEMEKKEQKMKEGLE